jgi:RimJ/RimL family protein N-acetyltransferase
MEVQTPEMQFKEYIIRPINSDDVQSFFTLVETNRKRLEDFFAGTVSKNKNLDATKAFIEEIIEKAEKRTYFPFAIIHNSTPGIVGYVDIKNIDWNIPKAELGCFIDEKYEGKGVSTEAVSKIIEYCFDVLQFNKLFLRTHETNTGSRKIAEKNGFEVEGIIRKDYKTTSGELVDLIYYGLLK